MSSNAVFNSGTTANALSISGASTAYFNNDTTNGGADVQRLSLTAGAGVNPLGLSGGTLSFATGAATLNNTLSFAGITLNQGVGNLNFVTGNAATISGTLARTAAGGGEINITYSGSLGTGGAGSQNVVFNTMSPGFMNGVVFANGVDFTTYSGTAVTVADYTASYTTSFSSNNGLANNIINDVVGSGLAMTISTAQSTSMSGLRLAGNNISINFNGADTSASLSFTGNAGGTAATAFLSNVGGIISTGGNNAINVPVLWAQRPPRITTWWFV